MNKIDGKDINVVLCPYCRKSNSVKHNYCVNCGGSLNLENENTFISDDNNTSIQQENKMDIKSKILIFIGLIFTFFFLSLFQIVGILFFIFLMALYFTYKGTSNPYDIFFKGLGKVIVIGGIFFFIMYGMCMVSLY